MSAYGYKQTSEALVKGQPKPTLLWANALVHGRAKPCVGAPALMLRHASTSPAFSLPAKHSGSC